MKVPFDMGIEVGIATRRLLFLFCYFLLRLFQIMKAVIYL